MPTKSAAPKKRVFKKAPPARARRNTSVSHKKVVKPIVDDIIKKHTEEKQIEEPVTPAEVAAPIEPKSIEPIIAVHPETPVSVPEQMPVDPEPSEQIAEHPIVEKEHKHLSWLTISIIIIVILVVAGLPSYYFYTQYQQTYKKYQDVVEKNPLSAKNEIPEIVAQVGALILLPTGDTVTLATVKDVTQVGNSPFFKNAKNGDKILIFKESNEHSSPSDKAILYRPSINKIIEVGQVNATGIMGQTVAPSPSVTASKSAVALYNGTTINGLAGRVEKDLAAKNATITVVSKATAQASTYKDTLVIDLTGNNQAAVASLATLVNGKVSKLPVTESRPATGDILIIIGSSYSAQ